MNPHHCPPAGPAALARSFWSHRQIILQMTKRDIIGRYRGSLVGLAWAFFNPLLMLLVYTFVFSVVFKARWGTGGADTSHSFASILFVGLIVHSMFAENVIRAPGLVVSHSNYVKRVVFPLEVLPWSLMGAAFFHALIGAIVLFGVMLAEGAALHWTIVLFPVVLTPLMVLTMGLSWLLAGAGVYLRDIGQIIGVLVTMMLFLSPVFYSVSALPVAIQPWIVLNPLTVIIEQARNVLIWGQLPDWASLGWYSLIALAVCWLGFFWFQKVRKGFADVL